MRLSGSIAYYAGWFERWSSSLDVTGSLEIRSYKHFGGLVNKMFSPCFAHVPLNIGLGSDLSATDDALVLRPQ